jgi:pyruvate/2-oxoglutarate dehydrogenase complex dihydrolipoamide dehydrogenase (E3) component
VSSLLEAALRRQGVDIHTAVEPQYFASDERGQRCVLAGPDHAIEVEFDKLLLAVGRSPNVEDLGLEDLGIPLAHSGTVAVDDHLRTAIPTIYACGDVAGPYQFTHMASHQAWYVAVNALFGRFRKFKVDYSIVPWATFTDPEVARVGVNEQEAGERGVPFEVTRYDISDLDRAIADGEAHGFVKVLTEPGRDRILGVTIVGYHAAELLAEFVLAMKHGIGLNKILGTIHVYPTLGESNKFVAGEWRKARKPQRLLDWAARYHAWARR